MEERKEKTILRVVNMIILLIILILLFLLIKKFNYNSLKSTGNVDIFNIECNSDDNDCNNQMDNNNPGNITDVFKDDEKLNSDQSYPMDNLNVEDDSKIWNSENELRIFSNAAYEFESIIAPGSSNVYQFVVNNNNSFNILYSINFIETNEHSINMKYKLKRNGEYILGGEDSWVNASDIKKDGLSLNASSHDTYQLEWKWVDNDNDTDVAFNEANYSLKIEINAKSA